MDQKDIKDLTFKILKDTPAEAELEKAFELFEKAQNVALALSNIGDQQDLTLTKIGTILSLNLFGLLLGGKNPKELTEEDWKGIANEVIDKAVLMDGQSYSVYIFDLYADYIDVSVKALESRMSGEKRQKQLEDIRALAYEIREKKEQLLNGEIVEVSYTEDCLWISLDAMIKCLAAYLSSFTGEEFGYLIMASSTLAFEYARLTLYRKEQALLDEYLQDQYLLDEQMQVKLDAFKRELEEESERFNALVAHAFDPDFRSSLMGSVELARAAGVKEDEILKTVDEVDDFFLS